MVAWTCRNFGLSEFELLWVGCSIYEGLYARQAYVIALSVALVCIKSMNFSCGFLPVPTLEMMQGAGLFFGMNLVFMKQQMFPCQMSTSLCLQTFPRGREVIVSQIWVYFNEVQLNLHSAVQESPITSCSWNSAMYSAHGRKRDIKNFRTASMLCSNCSRQWPVFTCLAIKDDVGTDASVDRANIKPMWHKLKMGRQKSVHYLALNWYIQANGYIASFVRSKAEATGN